MDCSSNRTWRPYANAESKKLTCFVGLGIGAVLLQEVATTEKYSSHSLQYLVLTQSCTFLLLLLDPARAKPAYFVAQRMVYSLCSVRPPHKNVVMEGWHFSRLNRGALQRQQPHTDSTKVGLHYASAIALGCPFFLETRAPNMPHKAVEILYDC